MGSLVRRTWLPARPFKARPDRLPRAMAERRRNLADARHHADGTAAGATASRCTMPNVAPLPDLVLYTRPSCSLCDEAREAIDLVIADRPARGEPVPSVV